MGKKVNGNPLIDIVYNAINIDIDDVWRTPFLLT